MRLFEMVDFGDVFCRMGEVKLDALAVPTCREPPAFDDGDLMRHVGVHRIVCNRVDSGLGHDLSGFVLLRPVRLRISLRQC